MYWGIYDDYTIRTVKPKTKSSILIRLSQPSYLAKGVDYKIYHLDEYKAVLELYIDDIREVNDKECYSQFKIFTSLHVMKLIDFIHEHDFDEVNVHCSAGISRSSAIMICISKILNLKEIEETILNSNCYLPNPLIIDTFNKIFLPQLIKEVSYKEVQQTNKKEECEVDVIEVEKGVFKLC